MRLIQAMGATLLLISSLLISSCNKEEEWPKIVGQEEYELIVASKKVPGVISSCGNNSSGEVFAVKKGNAAEWTDLAFISEFEYESGYEYRIRILETNYLDERMGEPAWTTYELREILSKEKKDSQGLPENFIPDALQ